MSYLLKRFVGFIAKIHTKNKTKPYKRSISVALMIMTGCNFTYLQNLNETNNVFMTKVILCIDVIRFHIDYIL